MSREYTCDERGRRAIQGENERNRSTPNEESRRSEIEKETTSKSRLSSTVALTISLFRKSGNWRKSARNPNLFSKMPIWKMANETSRSKSECRRLLSPFSTKNSSFSLYRKYGVIGQKKTEVKYVVAKKSQGGGSKPAGAKGPYKVVDKRLKKDKRAAKQRDKKKSSGGKGRGRGKGKVNKKQTQQKSTRNSNRKNRT